MTPTEDEPVQSSALGGATTPYRYEETLAMVKQVEKERPERPVSITLPSRAFYRLMDDLKYFESDKKYNSPLQTSVSYFTDVQNNSRWPRYSYDTSTSKMIIQCMPSPLQQCFSEAFLTAVHRTTGDLPPSVDATITTTSNEDFNEFSGRYAGSVKIPDAAVFHDDINGNLHVKVAMEVGFAENYEDLAQDIRKWLEGAGAAIAILVKIEEAPVYRNPSSNLSDQQKAELYSRTLRVETQDFRADGEFGPATYKGLKWVGEIASASLEVWKRDSRTGLAVTDRDAIVSHCYCSPRNSLVCR